ncbi:class I SAM-dependent methyltransferase [Treponema pedis]|uniref:Class I SAM-dependent methyltransferase n=1 Tax=Treponema pedis TaxID=409322 RepID=A0A7S7AWZ6_9SPIR|nr:class I SAM-dependent methyltransferase [Treponema pedis]QOW60601.1 class I SAM-dependent methyltransferase [Treponema pedis]QSI03871.1 class I SAM-dependent methyltransferase [Treponema pedis]
MEKLSDWFENETFWAEYAPVIFDTQRWAEAPTVAESVLKIIGVPSNNAGISILDAGCGPGRISIELAVRKAKVTGIDLIRPFLNAAMDSAQDENVDVELIQGDLRKFVRPAAFDAAISMYTSFGYCNTIEEDMLILKNIAQSLKADGWFILEMTGKEIAVRDFTEGEWFERGGFTVLTEYSVEGAWEGLKSRWILYDERGRKADHTYTQRLYSASELKNLMLLSGFSSVEVYGDFDFSPYNEKARTMVMVARR